MTAILDETESPHAVEEGAADIPARWSVRTGAFAIDMLPGLGVVATMALAALTMPQRGMWWWVCVVLGGFVILLMAINRLLLPTVIGWSLGRAFFGIAVVRRDRAPVGPWRLLVRDLAHLLDFASVFVGWLWPLWDSRRRTFADMMLHTQVRRVEAQRPPSTVRRLVATVVLTAALICAGGAMLSYSVVWQHDRAVDRTHAEISTQGPGIVEQLLSYDPKSLPGDFAHSQSLATDKYREQLVAQQQAVQKAGPVHNDYWVTNSSVLAATPDRATMLLLMQGQRGAPDNQWLITATVRVTFAKSADGHWRVDELTVVTKPLPVEDGR